jgi:hypothetical protein
MGGLSSILIGMTGKNLNVAGRNLVISLAGDFDKAFKCFLA